MTERLARASSRHPWRVVAVWLVAVVAAFPAIAMFLGDVLTADVEITSETESERADDLLARAFPQTREAQERDISEVVVVRATQGESAAASERVQQLARDLRTAGATAVVTSADGDALVSSDGDARALLVGLGFDGEDDVEDVYDTVQRLDDEPGYEAAVTGELSSDADQEQLSGDDLRTGELFFGLPASLVILLLVFGAVVAGLVPLILAIVSIVVALALAALVGQGFVLSLFMVNMLTGMGLALGIDYSLFVVSRFREERAHGREPLDAIVATGATASRAVLFSGMTFVLAMFGMMLVPSTIFRSLATGAILVGIVSVLAALTLLPAVLGLLGDRVNALRVPFFGRSRREGGKESRFWGASSTPSCAARASASCSARFLLALAAPVLGLRDGLAGHEHAARPQQSKQGYVVLNEEFPGRRPSRSRSPSPAIVVAARAGRHRPLEAALAGARVFGAPTVETSGRAT